MSCGAFNTAHSNTTTEPWSRLWKLNWRQRHCHGKHQVTISLL